MFAVLERNETRVRTIEFYGTVLTFRPHYVNGERRLAARIPDEAPRLAQIRANITARSNMTLMDDAVVASDPTMDPPTPAPASHHTSLAHLLGMAFACGWTMADLAGTAEDGHPGIAGGRSTLAGLTLTELALCVSPPDWRAQSPHAWPWQLAGFTPPSLPGWEPPVLANKPGPEAVDTTPPAAGAPFIAGTAPATPTTTTAEGEPAAAAATEPVAAGSEPAATATTTTAPPTPESLGYPAEEVQEAMSIIAALQAKRSSDKPLHFNAANYALQAAGLTSVGSAMLDAFLASITP